MTDGLTGPDLAKLLRELKANEPKVATNLRRNLRNVAKSAAEDVKTEVLKPPPNDAPGSVGTRAGIASGVGVRINTGAKSRSQGVAIVGSSKGLPADRKAMLRLYNKPQGWRHPVFAQERRSGGLRGFLGGTERVWVHQQGRPFFQPVLAKRTDDVQRAIQAAVDEANAALLRAK